MAAPITWAQAEGSLDLPPVMAWSAYGTSSSSYTQAVAIASAIQQSGGQTLRVLPGDNDVARTAPLMSGQVQFMATGLGAFFAQEGFFEFSAPNWGPVPIRLVATNVGGGGLGLVAAGDSGIGSMDDLAGKRVAYIQGSPSLNLGTQSWLAFAGLTWDDVERVDFSSYRAAGDAIVEGGIDVLMTATASPINRRLEASNRGIFWPPVPHSDTEGWERLNAIAPYFSPHMVTLGPTLSKEEPLEGSVAPFPMLTTLASQDEDLVYNMTKAIHELYSVYSASEPAAAGWALANQAFDFVIPFHEGAIRYYREAGVWTDEHDAHTERMLQRQAVLEEAWTAFSADAPEAGTEEYDEAWVAARASALTEAGFNPIWQ